MLNKAGSPLNQKLPATQGCRIEYQDDRFLEMSGNLHKAEQFLEVLMVGYDSMEKTLESTQNSKIRGLLQERLERQWDMVNSVVELTTQLKQKLFSSLHRDSKRLLE